MRAFVQRVRRARVVVAEEVVGEIGEGLVVLLGVRRGDGPDEVRWLAEKCAQLRIFPDGEQLMNRSLLECGGSALVVSQFTLYGDTRRGRRPSFAEAAPPEMAEPLYESFCDAMRGLGVRVATGRFAADMDVELTNRGPVTLLLETPVSGGESA